MGARHAGSSFPTAPRVTVTTAQAFASAVAANVAGMSLPVVAGRTYRLALAAIVQTALATTGVAHTIAAPAMTSMALLSQARSGTADAVNVTWQGLIRVPGTLVVPTAGITAATDMYLLIEGVLRPSANGNVQLQLASETGTENVTFISGTMSLEDVT